MAVSTKENGETTKKTVEELWPIATETFTKVIFSTASSTAKGSINTVRVTSMMGSTTSTSNKVTAVCSSSTVTSTSVSGSETNSTAKENTHSTKEKR
jgi:hypothetical protein